MTGRDLLALSLVTALMAAIMCTMIVQQHDCERRGGAYVEGLVWFVCVRAKRVPL